LLHPNHRLVHGPGQDLKLYRSVNIPIYYSPSTANNAAFTLSMSSWVHTRIPGRQRADQSEGKDAKQIRSRGTCRWCWSNMEAGEKNTEGSRGAARSKDVGGQGGSKNGERERALQLLNPPPAVARRPRRHARPPAVPLHAVGAVRRPRAWPRARACPAAAAAFAWQDRGGSSRAGWGQVVEPVDRQRVDGPGLHVCVNEKRVGYSSGEASGRRMSSGGGGVVVGGA